MTSPSPVKPPTIHVLMTNKMRKIILFLALVSSTMVLAQVSDPVVMTINGVPVPRSEFEYSYNKNNGADVIDKKTIDEYVDLFINYKLKVAAALDAHYDTLTSFKQEYTMYRDQQVRPTMVTDADVLVEAKKTYEEIKSYPCCITDTCAYSFFFCDGICR